MYPMLHWLLVLLLNSSPTTTSHSLKMAVGPLINSFVCSWIELQRLAHPAVQKTSFEIHSFGDRRELQAITALQLLDDDVVMAFIAQTIG